MNRIAVIYHDYPEEQIYETVNKKWACIGLFQLQEALRLRREAIIHYSMLYETGLLGVLLLPVARYKNYSPQNTTTQIDINQVFQRNSITKNSWILTGKDFVPFKKITHTEAAHYQGFI
jgi:hypothetical protein